MYYVVLLCFVMMLHVACYLVFDTYMCINLKEKSAFINVHYN